MVQGSAPDCDGLETNESDALAPLYSDGGFGVGDSDSVHVEEEIQMKESFSTLIRIKWVYPAFCEP